jgi:hypothetical protein
MPVISTYDWAHYKDYLGPLKLNSTLTDAEVDGVPKAVGDPHIGSFYKPDKLHFAQSTRIHEEYNWIKLTKNAFEHLEERFS